MHLPKQSICAVCTSQAEYRLKKKKKVRYAGATPAESSVSCLDQIRRKKENETTEKREMRDDLMKKQGEEKKRRSCKKVEDVQT